MSSSVSGHGTVLPDGSVLATAAAESTPLIDVSNSAKSGTLDRAVARGASGAVARLCHSNAVLLQAHRARSGGATGPLNNTNAEIYSPPYLFNTSGEPATRTQIVNAPSSADVGSVLNIEVDATDVSRVTLVKTSSTTHSVNLDQRFVELPFTRSATVVTATLPARSSDTPPGFYHLFVLNAGGVPSRFRGCCRSTSNRHRIPRSTSRRRSAGAAAALTNFRATPTRHSSASTAVSRP
jgi:hypothetical protein